MRRPFLSRKKGIISRRGAAAGPFEVRVIAARRRGETVHPIAKWASAACCAAALAACDLFGGGIEIHAGLEQAIKRGKSPFLLGEALTEKWTALCFFGAYDDGDHLDLYTGHEIEWWLVAFDGDRIVGKYQGDDGQLRLNPSNESRFCFTPQSRVTILSTSPPALRFEDGRPWSSKKK
jgi:hypothetical protein